MLLSKKSAAPLCGSLIQPPVLTRCTCLCRTPPLALHFFLWQMVLYQNHFHFHLSLMTLTIWLMTFSPIRLITLFSPMVVEQDYWLSTLFQLLVKAQDYFLTQVWVQLVEGDVQTHIGHLL